MSSRPSRVSSPRSILTRRSALAGAAGLGLGLPLLAACGGSGSTSAADPEQGSPAAASDAGPTAITATADVPVGGGIVLTDDKLVVTQPAAGQFKCFTAVCTHEGCLVSSVTATINCTCHGSAFDISTGAVVGGPAPSPLAEQTINVKGDQVVLS